METTKQLVELESLLEHMCKKHADGGILKVKALFYIGEYENLSVSMIIDRLGIKKSNFASMCKEFKKQGLVQQKTPFADKRCKCLCLTDKGKEQLDAFLFRLNRYAKKLEGLQKSLAEIITVLNKEL